MSVPRPPSLRIPSFRPKRKLQDYDSDNPMTSRFFSAPFSSSSSSSSFSSFSLHFFVRVGSRTIVHHTDPEATVSSVIDRIGALTGLPVLDVRLIHSGRQLDPDRTLFSYGISNDASLHLVARLRSTLHPRSWQLANEIVSAASRRSNLVPDLVEQFLRSFPTDPGQSSCHLQIFADSGIPQALVEMLLSNPVSRGVVEQAIRVVLLSFPSDEPLGSLAPLHCRRVGILMEFCKLLVTTVGNLDKVYHDCRSKLGSMLRAQRDVRLFSRENLSGVVIDMNVLFPFVAETTGKIIECLSDTPMRIVSGCIVATQGDLTDFSNFLTVMRRVVRGYIGGKRCIPDRLYHDGQSEYQKCFGLLRRMLNELVDKVDKCLEKVAVLLDQKGPMELQSIWGSWGHLLVILTKLNSFLKIYEDGAELLHPVLLSRRIAVNALIKHAKKDMKLRWLLKHKDVTDFEARRSLVFMLFSEGKDEYDELHEMLIDRSHLLAESFEYIGQAEAKALHGGLFMEFKNEEATGPGVLREWFCLVCRAIFNPQNVLFMPCPNDRRRFFPNPTSAVDPLHLEYFRFCGRVIALALMHKVQVGVLFDRIFFLQLTGKDVTLEDIQDADPCLYMSCKKILEMDAEYLDSDILGLTFVREFEELGTQRLVELVHGGKDIAVNSRNREQYVNLLVKHHFVTSISDQIAKFAEGFGDILSKAEHHILFFQGLDLQDFDLLLGGNDAIINVKEWREHTEYNGYKAKDHQIGWFWKIVEGMSAEQQRVLLFFWTSVKYLPADGFGGLASKLYIYRTMDSQDHLPASHTCFYRLCLPPYSSLSLMRERLQLITQEHVSCSFGFS